MLAPAVETRALSKIFGATPILRQINLKLFPAAAIIVIGGNGAGKSTLLRIVAGLSRPASGETLVFGTDSRNLTARERRRIGVLTHQSWLYPNLTARENLMFYANIYGLADPAAIADLWIERVGLSASAEARVGGFSRGMEQRLSIARALLVRPELLLLDEPFAALDQAGVAIVSELLRQAAANGAALLITAHSELVLGIRAQFHELSRGRLSLRSREEPREERLRSVLG